MIENNGRSLAGVLVRGVDIGSGTYVFELDPSLGVSMSSVAHAVCVQEACALVKADCSGANIFILILFNPISKFTPAEDGVCLRWSVYICVRRSLRMVYRNCKKTSVLYRYCHLLYRLISV
jgi:hypothetical protein